ncbi:MAG: methionine--tRNA ligase [Gemmatimonadota bacterium]
MASYYLTTAIDYSNGEPHVGHAFEKIGADAIARYRRLRGDDVRFVIGMDEHGQNVAREASARGTDPQRLVDDLAERWRETWRRLAISNDDFIRTTEPRHEAAVTELLTRILRSDDIYLDRYAGYYCERCEAFRKESELVDGRCPLHPSRDIQWTEEENYFFRLSAYRDRLLAHVEAHPDFIRPPSRKNEILRLLEGGLEDISASRARVPWGIPFPGAEGHTVYVWFDALPNYLSAVGFPDGEFETRWPAQLHVIGKDITRFHCVIWPAMLMSAGLELPRCVWAHGFVKVGGGKLSKSEAAALDLHELVARHGTDAFRYFMLREVPWHGDRDFPSVDAFLDRFDERYTSDLANDLGNLLNRTVSMTLRYRNGALDHEAGSTALDEKTAGTVAAYHEHMAEHRLLEALEAAMSVVRDANGFIDEREPWRLAKTPEAAGDLDTVLASLVRALSWTAAALAPFMPEKTEELWARLGGEGALPPFEALAGRYPRHVAGRSEGVLFPRPQS